ncbi:GAF domain-containing protein [Streptomyces sp. MAR4 CNY-716]
MTFDAASGLNVLTPDTDNDLQQRTARLHDLGLGEADPQFDAFAAGLARDADVPYAMVNLRTHLQFFAGLHSPPPGGDLPVVGRQMDHDHGYCPEVIDRRNALVLPDVTARPRFAGNPVVDLIGIRTYAGAPLIDEPTGIVLGTVCFVGPEPRDKSTGRAALEFINNRRDALMELIYARAAQLPTPPTAPPNHRNRHDHAPR